MAEFQLPALPYAVDALEPVIDSQTMKIHHDLHHGAYVTNLNAALKDHADLQSRTIEELIAGLAELPESIRTKVRNNGGGHLNHALFWQLMTPGGAKAPSGALAEAISGTFGSVDTLVQQVTDAGMTRFGSGWAWLTVSGGKLAVSSSANQDSPVTDGALPLIGVDVWEHAYYLKYQNRRAEYLKAWWSVLNWDVVAARFASAR